MSCKQEIEKLSLVGFCRLGALILSILILSQSGAEAAIKYWNVASGDWSDTDPCPWNVSPEPTSSDDAYIQNGGTANITSLGETCRTLYLGQAYPGTGAVQMTAGSLSSIDEYIGICDNGTFTQTGGTNSISSCLFLGNYHSASGTYNLRGTGELSAAYEYIGVLSNTGEFIQTGGTNTAPDIYVGSSGTYRLTGGTLNITNFVNQGTWDLSGSSATVNISSSIVALSGNIVTTSSDATLNMDSHSLLLVPAGHSVNEYFSHINSSGIIHQAGGTMDISPASSFSGTGVIDGHVDCQGTLAATSGSGITINGGLDISGTGSVSLGTGSLHVVYDAISALGGGTLTTSNEYFDAGTFNHSGGTNTVTNYLYIGNNAGSKGTYKLSDAGQLSAAYYEYIGYSGSGTFNQTGGTNSLYTLYLGMNAGSSGTYDLSGGGQLSSQAECIGYKGTGTFTQTGGTHSVAYYLYLGIDSGSRGTYNLKGGTLISKSISKVSGTAAFNFGGGTLQASGDFTITLPMTLTGEGGSANIDTAGYAVTLSGALSGVGGLNKIGSGTLTLNASETYSGDTTINGGTLEFVKGIGASGTSLVDVQSGKAVFKTVGVNKTNLNINTAALATFEVVSGAHSVGMISGGGTTLVDSGASLSVASIYQDILTVEGGATLTIRPLSGGPLGGEINPVPEPTTLVLLAMGAFGLLVYVWRRQK